MKQLDDQYKTLRSDAFALIRQMAFRTAPAGNRALVDATKEGFEDILPEQMNQLEQKSGATVYKIHSVVEAAEHRRKVLGAELSPVIDNSFDLSRELVEAKDPALWSTILEHLVERESKDQKTTAISLAELYSEAYAPITVHVACHAMRAQGLLEWATPSKWTGIVLVNSTYKGRRSLEQLQARYVEESGDEY